MELPVIWQSWELVIRLSDDLGVAQSVVGQFGDWSGRNVVVADFLPTGYAAYARILHPAYWQTTPTRWRDLAQPRGVEVGADMSFQLASGVDPGDQQGWQDAAPKVGSLPADSLRDLGQALAAHTATPDRCTYLMWNGWGFWGGRMHVARGGGTTAEQEQLAFNEASKKADAERAMLVDVPLVSRPWRDYYVFEGPLTATASSFQFGHWHQSPSMWWPQDQAWCVATEVDGDSTYLAASRDCIDAILDTAGLETIEVTAYTTMA